MTIMKSKGEREHPCLNRMPTWKNVDGKPFIMTTKLDEVTQAMIQYTMPTLSPTLIRMRLSNVNQRSHRPFVNLISRSLLPSF